MLSVPQIVQSKLKLKYIDFNNGSVDEYAICSASHAEHNKERTDAFSIGCWFRTTTVNFGVFLGKTRDATAGTALRGYDIYMFAGDGTLGFNLNNNFVPFGNYISKATLASFNDGRWHFYVGTYDGTSNTNGMHLWVDAVDQPTLVLRNNLTATIQNVAPLAMAVQSSILTTTSQHQISHGFIANRVLTGAEILDMYARRSPPPYDIFTRFPFLSGVIQGLWLPQLTDTNPTLTDSISGRDMTMVNMEAADILSR